MPYMDGRYMLVSRMCTRQTLFGWKICKHLLHAIIGLHGSIVKSFNHFAGNYFGEYEDDRLLVDMNSKKLNVSHINKSCLYT